MTVPKELKLEDITRFLNDIPLAIFEVTIDIKKESSTFSYLNSYAKNFFESLLTPEQFATGFKFNEILISMGQIDRADTTIKKVLEGEKVQIKNQQYLIKNRKGDQILIESTMSFSLIEDVIKVGGMLCERSKVIDREIPKTQLDYYKTIEEEVENLKEFFDKFDALIMILNEELRIQFISPNVGEDILYKPKDEVIGRTMEDIFPKGLADFFSSHISDVLSKGEYKDFEYHLPVDSKVRWFQARLIPVLVKDGKFNQIVAVIRDITNWRIKPID